MAAALSAIPFPLRDFADLVAFLVHHRFAVRPVAINLPSLARHKCTKHAQSVQKSPKFSSEGPEVFSLEIDIHHNITKRLENG